MNRRLGLWQIHLATVLLGFTGLFGRAPVSPGLLVFARSLVAGAALLLAIVWLGGRLRIPSPRQLLALMFSGIVLAAHWYCFFHSIQLSSVGIGLLSFSSYPLFVTLLEPLVFRERLRPVDLWITGLVAAGLALVTPSLDLADHVTRGVGWGVLAGFTCAVLALLNRSLVRACPAITVSFWQMIAAALVSSPVLGSLPPAVSGKTLGLLLVLGTVFTAVPQALTIASLRHVRAQLASVVIGLEPVYGILLAWGLLGETLTPRSVLGGVLIAGAVGLAMEKAPPDGSSPNLMDRHPPEG